MKYTKGKWVAKLRQSAGWEIYDEDGNTIAAMGWYQFPNSQMNEEIEQANALLISKAPEMLEALKSIAHLTCGMDSSNRKVIRVPLEKWDSIIELLKSIE